MIDELTFSVTATLCPDGMTHPISGHLCNRLDVHAPALFVVRRHACQGGPHRAGDPSTAQRRPVRSRRAVIAALAPAAGLLEHAPAIYLELIDDPPVAIARARRPRRRAHAMAGNVPSRLISSSCAARLAAR